MDNRFYSMVKASNYRYKNNLKVRIQDIRNLYQKYFGNVTNPKCPKCNKEMIWHSKYGKRSDVITIQHWEDGSLGFLCLACNNKHGASSNKNILDIAKNKKWCAKCKQIKEKIKFNNLHSSHDGKDRLCKECRNKYRIKTKEHMKQYQKIYNLKNKEKKNGKK